MSWLSFWLPRLVWGSVARKIEKDEHQRFPSHNFINGMCHNCWRAEGTIKHLDCVLRLTPDRVADMKKFCEEEDGVKY